MDALEQLKQVLLYKEIARVNGDTLFLKDGTQIDFYMSAKEALEYGIIDNVIEEKFTTIRNLTKTYSTITDVFGEINLGVIDLVTGTVYIYDLTERELFKFSPKDEKYKVKADVTLLQQAIRALLENAMKYSENNKKKWKNISNVSF